MVLFLNQGLELPVLPPVCRSLQVLIGCEMFSTFREHPIPCYDGPQA